MTFEELIEKLAEWPEGCTADQFREYQRGVLTPYLADREERIRTLTTELQTSELVIVGLQARIELVKGLAEKWHVDGEGENMMAVAMADELLAALDGETK